jgi:hypothetical protein
MKNLIFLLLVLTILSCKSEMDAVIKKGYFDSCSKANVETLVENFFNYPNWESFISPDDNRYHLNASGQIVFDETAVNVLLQFEIEEGNRWRVNALELNGKPQDLDVILELIEEMCNDL